MVMTKKEAAQQQRGIEEVLIRMTTPNWHSRGVPNHGQIALSLGKWLRRAAVNPTSPGRRNTPTGAGSNLDTLTFMSLSSHRVCVDAARNGYPTPCSNKISPTVLLILQHGSLDGPNHLRSREERSSIPPSRVPNSSSGFDPHTQRAHSSHLAPSSEISCRPVR